jgi:hypothetical protein
MLQSCATTWHKTTSSSLGQHKLIEPADIESTAIRVRQCCKLPSRGELCHLTCVYAISKCRLMLSGDALRQGCRSHMDHASIARSVAF